MTLGDCANTKVLLQHEKTLITLVEERYLCHAEGTVKMRLTLLINALAYLL